MALEIPAPWELVEDDKGFQHIHHPREDDGTCTGDLVATCFQDERHAEMLRAAPEMVRALEKAAARFTHIKAALDSGRLMTATARMSFGNEVWHMECEVRALLSAVKGEI